MSPSTSLDHTLDVVCEACGGRMRRAGAWVVTCPSCGFLASTLAPGVGTGVDGLETLRLQNYERMLDRIERLKPLKGARLLEVGSAWGWFLAAADRRGALTHGIEPETANAERSRASGLRVDNGFFPDDLTAEGLYDVIVFNDVFEHIPSPSRMVSKIEARLAPGGFAVFNCPSSDGIFFRVARGLAAIGVSGPYERLWQKNYASPHVSYFNPATLKLLIERNSGLREVDRFSLDSVTRAGLSSRVKDAGTGLAGWIIFGGVWCLSFAQALLPRDIGVNIFRKPKT